MRQVQPCTLCKLRKLIQLLGRKKPVKLKTETDDTSTCLGLPVVLLTIRQLTRSIQLNNKIIARTEPNQQPVYACLGVGCALTTRKVKLCLEFTNREEVPPISNCSKSQLCPEFHRRGEGSYQPKIVKVQAGIHVQRKWVLPAQHFWARGRPFARLL